MLREWPTNPEKKPCGDIFINTFYQSSCNLDKGHNGPHCVIIENHIATWVYKSWIYEHGYTKYVDVTIEEVIEMNNPKSTTIASI